MTQNDGITRAHADWLTIAGDDVAECNSLQHTETPKIPVSKVRAVDVLALALVEPDDDRFAARLSAAMDYAELNQHDIDEYLSKVDDLVADLLEQRTIMTIHWQE